MRTLPPGVGSACDQVNQVVIILRRCKDRRAVEYRWPAIARRLEDVLRRVDSTARRGGASPGVIGPLRRLDQVVRELPALDEPGAEPLRAEFRALVARIRERA
jgi:hypothetical protein